MFSVCSHTINTSRIAAIASRWCTYLHFVVNLQLRKGREEVNEELMKDLNNTPKIELLKCVGD